MNGHFRLVYVSLDMSECEYWVLPNTLKKVWHLIDFHIWE